MNPPWHRGTPLRNWVVALDDPGSWGACARTLVFQRDHALGPDGRVKSRWSYGAGTRRDTEPREAVVFRGSVSRLEAVGSQTENGSYA